MNCKRTLALLITMAILLLGTSQVTGQQDTPASTEGTYGSAFTYQGQLKDAAGPVNGQCDLSFKLWDAASEGSQVGWTYLLEGVEIDDGLFTAWLDFGGVHDGNARWLEVAVRCPAGSGEYVILDPRQELTGAPAALSLALPFYAEANIAGPLVSFHNSGDGEAAVFSSQQGFALWVEAAGLDGLHVATAGQDGLRVVSAGDRGLAVDASGGDGVYVGSVGSPINGVSGPDKNGFEVAGAEGNGLYVGWADGDGVFVNSAGASGLAVSSADYHGVFVNSAGYDGVNVFSAGRDGVSVYSAGSDGVFVSSAGQDGVFVTSAGNDGVAVNSAGNDGVAVGWAGNDGMHVQNAGSPSTATGSTAKNGFEVAGAEGYGLYVGRADLDGVYVNSTAWHGLNVAGAGVDGLYVSSAGSDGVDVAGGAYAGNFHGDIYVSGNCIGCALAVFGLSAGDQPLTPGQIVAIQGIEATTLDNAPALWRVVSAGEGAAAVGVVRGKAELDEAPEGTTLREDETGQRLVPRSGVAQPGGYLTIVIYGPMQVRVSAADGAIEPGTRLAVGKMGVARPLKTVVVEGLTLAESAPVLGIALDAPDKDGLVWVLVNPQ
jgi:hypothetical protein